MPGVLDDFIRIPLLQPSIPANSPQFWQSDKAHKNCHFWHPKKWTWVPKKRLSPNPYENPLFAKKNGVQIGQLLPLWAHFHFTPGSRGSPPCTLSQHPDNRETGYSNPPNCSLIQFFKPQILKGSMTAFNQNCWQPLIWQSYWYIFWVSLYTTLMHFCSSQFQKETHSRSNLVWKKEVFYIGLYGAAILSSQDGHQ